jgi:hypothetical protein
MSRQQKDPLRPLTADERQELTRLSRSLSAPVTKSWQPSWTHAGRARDQSRRPIGLLAGVGRALQAREGLWPFIPQESAADL